VKINVFHNREQRDKTSRTGKRGIQLAGSAVEGSLGLNMSVLFFLSADDASLVLELLTLPSSNRQESGRCTGTNRNRPGHGRVAQMVETACGRLDLHRQSGL
jgi:hypothetical protein